jgi:CRISPR-associated protein (cas_TM1812).
MLPAKTQTLCQKGDPMKALTFLGKGDYKTVTYVWHESDKDPWCEARLFPAALDRFFEPKEIVVFLTSEAEGKHVPFRS